MTIYFYCHLTHSSVPHHHALDRLHCGAESGHDIIKKSANINNYWVVSLVWVKRGLSVICLNDGVVRSLNNCRSRLGWFGLVTAELAGFLCLSWLTGYAVGAGRCECMYLSLNSLVHTLHSNNHHEHRRYTMIMNSFQMLRETLGRVHYTNSQKSESRFQVRITS